MSNSHEQSLDEDVIFLPVSETSPDFLYSETERLAVERLLNVGPEAFYSTAGSEHSSSFLSPEEVNDITNWVQDYHLSPLPKEEHWDNGLDLGYEGYSSTYYPAHSDVPPPSLDLGWPERNPWGQNNSVKVYTSPPAEGEPSVRELIRQHLQMATQVIAIVTDRLTDGAVIGDLHNAASRGVPVYIILNQRTTHESTIQRLRHPNMQVRVLGGKSFCSRAGRMVVGEMKDKFVMVDLQTVIHGSYSLTWSDAHLHRQLVTVLTGSVMDSFDQEFRILFAASSPVPEPRRTSSNQIANHINNFSDIWLPKHLPFSDAEINNPPSPPSDALLDWDAMGVVTGGCSVPNSPLEEHEDVFLKEKPIPVNNVMMDKNTKFADNFFSNKHLDLSKKRFSEPPPPISPVTNNDSPLIDFYSQIKPTLKEPLTPEISIQTSQTKSTLKEPLTPEISLQTSQTKPTLKEPLTPEISIETSQTKSTLKEPLTPEISIETSQKNPTLKERHLPEIRIEPVVERTVARQISQENTKYDKYLKRPERKPEPLHNFNVFSPIKRHQDVNQETTVKVEKSDSNDGSFKIENKASSRKPVILRLPQAEDTSSLSDIMNRMKLKQSTYEYPKDHQWEHQREHQREPQREPHREPPWERSKTAFSELSRSLMDLSVSSPEQDNKTAPVPRFRAGAFDVEFVTPALALMQKRNDHIRSTLYRSPMNFQPRERPRSYAFSPDWKGSLSELDTKDEGH